MAYKQTYPKNCPDCGTLQILKPAGQNKVTGKPYDAFYTCPNGCWKKHKPLNTTNQPLTSVKQPNFANLEALVGKLEARIKVLEEIVFPDDSKDIKVDF